MKKLKSLVTKLIFGFIIYAETSNAQVNLETFRKLGIVSQLVEIKYVSEAYLSSGLNTKDEDEMVKNYNIVRLEVDIIIMQLIGDMNATNSSLIFNRLNNHYKRKSLASSGNIKPNISEYCNAFNELYKNYEIYILSKIDRSQASVAPKIADIDFLAIASFFESTWKDIQEFRHQKVEGISVVLRSLLLAPADNFKKDDEKKEN